jgi:hypothetical protein
MSMRTMSQTLTNIRGTISRHVWWLALILLFVAAAFGIYRYVTSPTATTPAASAKRATSLDPAVQSVFDYLRAHSTVQPFPTPAAPLDAAQQSVMDYVRAHDSVDRSQAPWDSVVQAVLDYLRAHSR